jgi:glycosyltransferase involved in cell wall biosynthesis/GT2 family glycosyltransferase
MTICIVTCDIVGPIRNGGIGTAYYSLARLLADAGHRVTVLYALGRFCEQGRIEQWVEEYRRLGIEFVPVPDDVDVRGHSAMKIAHAVYRWLRDRRFDIVHVHEWRGIAFYALQAKRQGLALQASLVCVGAHSPVLWHKEGMNELASAEELEVDFMERQSVALADVLWSPSEHMVQWMRREGWQLPRRVMTRQYVVLGSRPDDAASTGTTPVREVVFFGRLETRKGLDVFCAALDRLVARGVALPRVTFLGKPATVGGVPSEQYLARRAARWPFRWQVIGTMDRDRALAYLAEPGRLAVLPSRIDNLPYTVLECLAAGVPFLASNTGGIPEMIRDEDRPAVLFDLTAESLGDHLQRALATGARAIRPRTPFERANRDWLEWHPRARRDRTRPVRPAATPLVSVVLTHFNRPQLLAQALDSLRRQDYPALEVVLVDDGSDQPEAVRFVASLDDEFEARGWRIVRQVNRYLGAARNTGVRNSRGTYVLFMDDDNIAEAHEVSTFVRAAETSGADILTCFLRVFQGSEPPASDAGTYCWPFLGGAVAPGVTRNSFGDANAFVRRAAFDRIGGFTEDVGIGCEDWELFARATLAGCRLMVVPEPLVRYRQSVQGMLSTTSQHANRMRALRPYFAHVPAPLRGLLHLAHAPASPVAERPSAARLDHVRRAVVFGTGEGGRVALTLAARCGWSVEYLVDNNASAWHTEAHGLGVRPPAALEARDYDLVIVASQAGKAAIFTQLEQLGLSHTEHFVHFLEPISVSGVTAQVVL